MLFGAALWNARTSRRYWLTGPSSTYRRQHHAGALLESARRPKNRPSGGGSGPRHNRHGRARCMQLESRDRCPERGPVTKPRSLTTARVRTMPVQRLVGHYTPFGIQGKRHVMRERRNRREGRWLGIVRTEWRGRQFVHAYMHTVTTLKGCLIFQESKMGGAGDGPGAPGGLTGR